MIYKLTYYNCTDIEQCIKGCESNVEVNISISVATNETTTLN